MKKVITSAIFLFMVLNQAYAQLWSSAIPDEIHIVPRGLVLIGDFDNTGVLCSTGPKAIYLSNLDPQFKEKLTLALTAKATDKKIRVAINQPIEYSCIKILTLGYVPIASHYFWQLVD